MSGKLLSEHHFEFLSFKGGCTGSSESTLVKMPHCWKSRVMAHLSIYRKDRAEHQQEKRWKEFRNSFNNKEYNINPAFSNRTSALYDNAGAHHEGVTDDTDGQHAHHRDSHHNHYDAEIRRRSEDIAVWEA